MTQENIVKIVRACGAAFGTGRKIAIVLPRPCTGSLRMRLDGSRSPLGDVACENADGHAVCYFDPADVLAWLCARGHVQIEEVPR